MKKLTQYAKKRLILRSRNERKRTLGRKKTFWDYTLSPSSTFPARSLKYAPSPEQGCDLVLATKKKHVGQKVISFEPPSKFSLRENYHSVVSFLQTFRSFIYGASNKKQKGIIDFTKIEEITPGAALVLAAEMFRWQKSK